MSTKTYDIATQLSEGVWVFNIGNTDWGDRANYNFELLNESLKGKTITFKVGNSTVGTVNTMSDNVVTFDVPTNEEIDALI